MPRFAAIDVGTNTVLMAVAERGVGGRLLPVLEREEITRLGEGVDRTRRLSPQAMERTAAVLCRFAEEARAEGVSSFAAGATSAARDAANGSELIALIRERGLQPGDRLPCEHELAATFAVSRATVREALRRLEHLGLVRVVQGQGSFLSAVPPLTSWTSPASERKTRATAPTSTTGTTAGSPSTATTS